jgi:hypothetical protein
MVEPTVRRVHHDEIRPGLLVESIRADYEAFDFPGAPSRTVYAGHPGKVLGDFGGPHVVVEWYGLEDSDECQMTGHAYDQSRTYQGLGLLAGPEYQRRCERLDDGLRPVEVTS